jgi:hypothetical protein
VGKDHLACLGIDDRIIGLLKWVLHIVSVESTALNYLSTDSNCSEFRAQ